MRNNLAQNQSQIELVVLKTVYLKSTNVPVFFTIIFFWVLNRTKYVYESGFASTPLSNLVPSHPCT